MAEVSITILRDRCPELFALCELLTEERESLASAQRGKEAAERELEELRRKYAVASEDYVQAQAEMGQLQQERDRLAARLDAAEKAIRFVLEQNKVRSDGWVKVLSDFLLSPPITNLSEISSSLIVSTSAVAEEEK